MKTANLSRRKRAIDFKSDSFSLSHAKTYLGRLVQKASQGHAVYIVSGQHRFILQEVPPIDPIPIRPAGYFADGYGKDDVQDLNRLARASVIRVPDNIE